MKNVGIIGYGRFGKVLADLLSKKYNVLVIDSNPNLDEKVEFSSIEEILECFLVFIAVPIRSFEAVVQEIAQHKLYNTTIVDVCSVKVYPVDIMKKYLPEHVGIIASHPHFGPDSYSPFRELKTTLCNVRDAYNRFSELVEFFESQSIRIINLSPDEHDKMAAASQGITHFIGRILNESGVRSTDINTLGFNELLGVIEQTCNDSWDLFKDLQKYNPYTNDMIDDLVTVIENIHKQIKKDAN
jgi:prephenate dehydrogenase